MDRSWFEHACHWTWTRHAERRAKARGIGKALIAMIIAASDRERPVGGGCVAISVSRDQASGLRAEGLSPALLEALRRHALILDDNGGIVTACKLLRGRRGRSYRRGRR